MPRRNDARLGAAELIAAEAEAHEASVLACADGQLLLGLRLRRVDGFIARYTLKVDARAPQVSAREEAPDRLPAFCPERHINDDGSFCMTWQAAEQLLVTDTESAVRWWGTLLQYLRLQERATRLGRWPNHSAWAHGDAARHQLIAEASARGLTASFEEALKRRALTAITSRRGSGRFLELRREGRRILSVWVEGQRIATRRQACLCGSGRPMGWCGAHAREAAALTKALWDWQKAEEAFWRTFKDRTCCGSVAGCPLAGRAAPALVRRRSAPAPRLRADPPERRPTAAARRRQMNRTTPSLRPSAEAGGL
ncbi:hypothetical protein M9M90_07020 [Phenylobacterium sp. LH3H17]|uniref:E2 domain-containing protein n=1 Tax=Phenylobacterium sp. LH3H17 TaxID=2903901 RepID=UPI0020C9C3BB|nr:E2 domain-containing protein [Phenylobacterium sp. LH3H17]UTP40927.1 hypothetical protein M9M90_07020 [Phenylobacterium sp. LH3H17]